MKVITFINNKDNYEYISTKRKICWRIIDKAMVKKNKFILICEILFRTNDHEFIFILNTKNMTLSIQINNNKTIIAPAFGLNRYPVFKIKNVEEASEFVHRLLVGMDLMKEIKKTEHIKIVTSADYLDVLDLYVKE